MQQICLTFWCKTCSITECSKTEILELSMNGSICAKLSRTWHWFCNLKPRLGVIDLRSFSARTSPNKLNQIKIVFSRCFSIYWPMQTSSLSTAKLQYKLTSWGHLFCSASSIQVLEFPRKNRGCSLPKVCSLSTDSIWIQLDADLAYAYASVF